MEEERGRKRRRRKEKYYSDNLRCSGDGLNSVSVPLLVDVFLAFNNGFLQVKVKLSDLPARKQAPH